MFIILSKILPLFVYPLGLACVLLFAAVLMKKPKARLVLILLAVLILWLSSTNFVSEALARSLEWRYLPPEQIPQAEVIVVLGGGTEPALYPRLDVEVNSAGDRVIAAAQLYKQGKAPVILLSGGYITWLDESQSSPAEEMAALLEMMGVPADALWLESESQNTYENAVFSRQVLEEKEINNIILITSAMHMPRAVGLFEKQGLGVIPVPVDYSIIQAKTGESALVKIMKFLPNAGSLAVTTNALKEYLGIFTYRLQGWL